MANTLDQSMPWVQLEGDETIVITARELMKIAVDYRADGVSGSLDEMGGRRIFRLPSAHGDIPFVVFIQLRPSDDIANVSLYELMGGK